MELVAALIVAIWIMLPAYVPNNLAVLAGGGQPIDGYRTWRGSRLLGDGKTWRGAAAGIAAGMLLAGILNLVQPEIATAFGPELPRFSVAIAIAFPTGAIAGDMAASFVKRQTGRKRGAPFPLVDQLDFLVGALALGGLLDLAWMLTAFTPLVLGIVIVLTPILHIGTNMVAYLGGFKEQPW